MRRRDRARLEVVGRGRAAEGHVQVRVDVDAAGDDVLSGRVDDPVGLGRQRGPDRGDLLSLDQDVPAVLVGRRDDRTAPDEKAHGSSCAMGW